MKCNTKAAFADFTDFLRPEEKHFECRALHLVLTRPQLGVVSLDQGLFHAKKKIPPESWIPSTALANFSNHSAP